MLPAQYQPAILQQTFIPSSGSMGPSSPSVTLSDTTLLCSFGLSSQTQIKGQLEWGGECRTQAPRGARLINGLFSV